eukprot:5496126-Prymnesium_polylepis.1
MRWRLAVKVTRLALLFPVQQHALREVSGGVHDERQERYGFVAVSKLYKDLFEPALFVWAVHDAEPSRGAGASGNRRSGGRRRAARACERAGRLFQAVGGLFQDAPGGGIHRRRQVTGTQHTPSGRRASQAGRLGAEGAASGGPHSEAAAGAHQDADHE